TNASAEAAGPGGAVVTYQVSATDEVDGAVAPSCTRASGSLFALGQTLVTCTAHDAAGNTATAGFTVTVVDTTAPVITVPGTLTACPGGASVSYTASAADAVDGAVVPTCTRASGATFALGLTTVTCTAHDAAGNTATAGFTVTVVDTTAPVITVPGTLTAVATS